MKKKVIYQITRHKVTLVEVENEQQENIIKELNRDFEKTDKQEKRAKARCTSLEMLYESEGFKIADPNSSVEERMAEQEEHNELYKGISTLAKKQKEYVYLRFWKGMTLQQIADCKGVHISTVKESLDSAILKLRKFLKKF